MAGAGISIPPELDFDYTTSFCLLEYHEVTIVSDFDEASLTKHRREWTEFHRYPLNSSGRAESILKALSPTLKNSIASQLSTMISKYFCMLSRYPFARTSSFRSRQ